MQVGDEDIFANSFPEARFNSWVVGELHVLDRRILPNGRRDDFEHNAPYATLVNQLGPLCRDLARRCRVSSMSRSRLQLFLKNEARSKELLRGVRLGLTGGRSRRSMLRELDRLLGQMRSSAQRALFADAMSAALERRLKRLLRERSRIGESDRGSMGLRVPAAKRRLYADIVRFVNASAPSKRIAASMVRRIGSMMSRKSRD